MEENRCVYVNIYYTIHSNNAENEYKSMYSETIKSLLFLIDQFKEVQCSVRAYCPILQLKYYFTVLGRNSFPQYNF